MESADRTIVIDGHALAYRRVGRGEPMLLVHGITTWSFLWDGLLDLLAEHHQVIAVDLLGRGRSDLMEIAADLGQLVPIDEPERLAGLVLKAARRAG